VQRSLCGTTPNIGGANGREIRILHRAYIAESELHDCLRMPRQADEFYLDHLLAVHTDDGAEITSAKTEFG
jgi:hypothetical protein